MKTHLWAQRVAGGKERPGRKICDDDNIRCLQGFGYLTGKPMSHKVQYLQLNYNDDFLGHCGLPVNSP